MDTRAGLGPGGILARSRNLRPLSDEIRSTNPLISLRISGSRFSMETRTVSSSGMKRNSSTNSSKMAKEGWPVTVGDKVGFIITKKPGKLYQKAEPHFKVSLDQVDYDYYVHNQIVPAAARVLEVFGIRDEDLLGPSRGQVSL